MNGYIRKWEVGDMAKGKLQHAVPGTYLCISTLIHCETRGLLKMFSMKHL